MNIYPAAFNAATAGSVFPALTKMKSVSYVDMAKMLISASAKMPDNFAKIPVKLKSNGPMTSMHVQPVLQRWLFKAKKLGHTMEMASSVRVT